MTPSFDYIEIEPIEFEKIGATFTKLEEDAGYGFKNLLRNIIVGYL